MFSNSINPEPKDIDLTKIKFKFMHEKIGSVGFKEATFDAYSLATLMYHRPHHLLQQIYMGMKIIDGNALKDMDANTFNALIQYGNDLCATPSPKMGK